MESTMKKAHGLYFNCEVAISVRLVKRCSDVNEIFSSHDLEGATKSCG